MSLLSYTVLLLSFLTAVVHAVPLTLRDVYDPPITSPNAQTVWTVGEIQTVTWDTSNLPPPGQLTNPNGKIVLGFLTSGSENLMLDSPLAQGFPLADGKVQITVPAVDPKTSYIVVLFGDSGNASPAFTIKAAGSSVAPSTAPASQSTVTTSESQAPNTQPTSTPNDQTTVSSNQPVLTATGSSSNVNTSSISPALTSPTSGAALSSSASSSTTSSSVTGTAQAQRSSSGAWKSFGVSQLSIFLVVVLPISLLIT